MLLLHHSFHLPFPLQNGLPDLSFSITRSILFINYGLFFSGSAAQRGLWPPRPRGFFITHNDVPQSVGLLWMSHQLVSETST
jgi:hypothetical protein